MKTRALLLGVLLLSTAFVAACGSSGSDAGGRDGATDAMGSGGGGGPGGAQDAGGTGGASDTGAGDVVSTADAASPDASSDASTTDATVRACGSTPVVPGGFCVMGNKILRDSDGTQMLFHGANVPGLEWDANNSKVTENSFKLLGSWGAGIVRVPLNQSYWLADEDGYKARVASVVGWAGSNGLVAILDLHRIERSEVFNDQRPMPNAASLTFWTEVAGTYKDNPRVFFELYNEPQDATWEQWENGGTVNGWDFVGIKAVYQTVRATGANNIVLVSGINWAYSLAEVLTRPFPNPFNIAYVTHLYNYSGKQPADWQKNWLFVAQSAPVFVTEFGNGGTYTGNSGDSYVNSVISTAASSGLHWTAWALYPFTSNGMVDSTWNPAANSFPLTSYGTTVKNAI